MKKCRAFYPIAGQRRAWNRWATQALSRERDDALRAAKGGSVLRRMACAAKWLLIGAAAGAVAVKLAR